MRMLEGVRVIDVTMWAFCPAAGAVLAEWGADVIHVENAKSPDPARLFFGQGSLEPDGAHFIFKHYNRGKRGIALDLASEGGREALYELVREADVFLTSFLPKTRKKLGFDVDDLRKINPRLIYAKGTGAGPLGPESERGGYDSVSFWARSSLASSAMRFGELAEPPAPAGHGDGISGLVFAGGIAAALYGRERSGEAAVVDSSLLGTAAWYNGPAIISAIKDPAAPFGAKVPRELTSWTQLTYTTSDRRFIALTFLGDFQDEFLDLCELVGREDLTQDPRFATSADRGANSNALSQILDEVFATKTFAEWKPILLKSKGVWGPVQNTDEMPDDPQVKANRMIRTFPDASGTQTFVMPPLMFNEDSGPGNRAPDFGEHTDEILREICGYDDPRISALRSVGDIA